jgi:ATP-dependent exoDNAse (exonuclease V) alpha subunit
MTYPHVNTVHEISEDERWTYFTERVILAAKNSDVSDLNEKTLKWLMGEEKTYYSADSAFDDGGNRDDGVPHEYLNSIIISGMPLHHTTLKIGAPILLLRNLDRDGGLCNGTRLIITALRERVIEGKILGGTHAGKTAFIPRISLETSQSSGLPFTLRRRQLPILLAFAITINKSQGQSLKVIGIHLATSPVFAHGQLYVAISRATDCRQIRISLPKGAKGNTENIVYKEVLPNEIFDESMME